MQIERDLISQRGFTLIEVLIAILIFSLGLIAAFTLTSTATSLSTRSKQEIIATNLLREQIEIIKNIRDTNFLALRDYDSLTGVNTPCPTSGCAPLTPGYWVVWPKYLSWVHVSAERLTLLSPPSSAPLWPTPSSLAHKAWVIAEASPWYTGPRQLRYCLDTLGRYRQGSVCSGPGVTLTPYYGFMLVRPVMTPATTGSSITPVDGALQITAYFATTEWGYRELSMTTIITDFKK